MWKKGQFFFLGGVLLANVWLFASDAGGGDHSPTDNSDNTTPERIVAKLIPDQRAMVGAPNTVIDLNQVFAETEIAKNGGSINVEIVRNGKRVATTILKDGVLTLKWGNQIGKKQEIVLRATNANGEQLYTRFSVELWAPDYLQLILTVLGGLGVFLLGMKNLSEGIQAVAGNRLRRMIGTVTDNRLMATGVGVFVTMMVQSSTITTVITVGFVNSSLMTLSQGIGVIMGANVGTTITGWILVLKIGKYGLPIAGAAAFVFLFSKNDRWRYSALACLGLGFIFFGLELMKNGFETVKELPAFEAWFETFQADSYFGVLKCAAVGCVLTFIVQSSSATLGITIGLAQIGVIQFETAAALVLGENIGTTITAWLASLAASTNAKRAAYFHILFNTVGVTWITAVFPFYMNLIKYVIAGDPSASITPDQSTSAIAATHTGFNVVNTLVFLPFAVWFAKLLTRLVPEKPPTESPHLSQLDVRMLESPIIGVEQSRGEMLRIAAICENMMSDLRRILVIEPFDSGLMKKIFAHEEEIDARQHEVVAFMTELLSANVPHDVIDEARRQLRMADELESVSDYISRIAKARRKLHRAGLRLPEEEQQKLLDLHDMTAEYLHAVRMAYEANRTGHIREFDDRAHAISQRTKQLNREFLEKMAELDPLIDVAYNRQITGYRRIRDHTVNIAEALAGEK